MSWTYRDLGEDWEPIPGSAELPGPRTAYLGFDRYRAKIVIGYTERGGYHSFLGPNVDDDCDIIAFAPLSETTEPDTAEMMRRSGWNGQPAYPDADVPILMRKP